MNQRQIKESFEYREIIIDQKLIEMGKIVGKEVAEDAGKKTEKIPNSTLRKVQGDFHKQLEARLSDPDFDEVWALLGFAHSEQLLQAEQREQYCPVQLADVAESIMIAHQIRNKLQIIRNMHTYAESELLKSKIMGLLQICTELVGHITSDPFTNPTPAPGHASPEEAEDRF